MVCADQRWHIQATGLIMNKTGLIVILAAFEIIGLTVMVWVVFK
jgi:hypothetical protein